MSDIKATLTPSNRLLVTNYSVGGSVASVTLTNLIDVDASNLADGALLIYRESQGTGKWVASVDLDNENTVLEGGTF
jgi:hypothetical protein